MITRLILLVLLLTSLGCERDFPDSLPDCFREENGFKADRCPSEGACEFKIYANSDLIVHTEEQWVWMEQIKGEHLVFQYQYTKRDHPQIADDEYSETIWFKVKPNGNTFFLKTNELEDAAVLFNRACFCIDGGLHKIKTGCIFGIKNSDNSWEVFLNLEASTNFNVYHRMKREVFRNVR